jgi:hypothetical protein
MHVLQLAKVPRSSLSLFKLLLEVQLQFLFVHKKEHVKELILFLESHSISLSAEKRPVQSRIVPASWLAKLRPPRTHVLHSITQTRLSRAFLPALPELQLVQSVRRRPPIVLMLPRRRIQCLPRSQIGR